VAVLAYGVVAVSEDKEKSFEANLKAIEDIVHRLEEGNLPLNESLAAYERGVQLTRWCEKQLTEAEQKIQKLVREGDQIKPEPLDSSDKQ